jgi:hypothetical protein
VRLPLDLTSLGLPGCELLVSGNVIEPLIVAGGIARWSLPVPPDPALVGATFHQQALVVDAGANAAGLLVSNGASGRIGTR